MGNGQTTDIRRKGGKEVVSRGDAVILMIASAAAAVATTAATVAGIIAYSNSPATLELPIATGRLAAQGLDMGATGYYTTLQATIPELPAAEATMLAWAAALSQAGILSVLVLLFLLGYRLRSSVLFTAGSVQIIGACGAVLAVASIAAQVLDQAARGRLAALTGAVQGSEEEGLIFVGHFDMAPLAAGLVLLLVAGVFEYGRRLQKDTEGLV